MNWEIVSFRLTLGIKVCIKVLRYDVCVSVLMLSLVNINNRTGLTGDNTKESSLIASGSAYGGKLVGILTFGLTLLWVSFISSCRTPLP